MKLSTAVFALVSLVSSVSAVGPMRASAGLLKAARKLEENGEDQEEENEYSFLGDYSLKLLSCKSGETYINPENGEYEYSSVVFRLCPADSCSNDASGGCSSGYGDFVVGLNSFVQEYLEAKREEMQGDDGFNMEELGECREYEVDQDADDENENAYQYFLGPACSEDGTDIKVEMYLDEDCSQVSEETTFEEISNGVSMPYESGGLVGYGCESCMAYNDNGEYELSEMCMKLYENSGKCESSMDTFSQYGKQEESCEFIESLVPKKSGVGAGKAIGWTFFILVVLGGGFVGWTMYKKSKDDRTQGLMS